MLDGAVRLMMGAALRDGMGWMLDWRERLGLKRDGMGCWDDRLG